ncbi:NUDIX domain-containing protein [Sedimenticola selenatireducens]|uniref:NUDIX domain-containing protein n=1 Tax=Sedimenticola selenatireducens TaxID=191960 RepID=A0A557SN26_9GAMM|nr:NUDIX domain-containing protein [Sedimenticola selenatireducens]TVO78712.1 NUDIX domain-containing protein [Sedimenticola selenatireducens]TVT62074.1 MAG: NUDIX domain-containing protein [Sedimenticola selenatireducens]
MRDAVAAILVHEDEVFVIKRQDYLRAFPGYYAFPGGKVDEEDAAFTYDHPLIAEFKPERIRALIREVEEELGFDLERAIHADQVEQIELLGIAITPAFERVRFHAHYYKIVLKSKPQFKPDSNEIAWSDWMKGEAFLQRYTSGEGMMVIPVMRTARALARDMGIRKIAPITLEYDADQELAYLEMIHGLGYIPTRSNTLPPAEYTYALIIGTGDAPRYLVDPAPADDAVMERLLNTLKRYPVDGILITHHHRDHHERSPDIARRLNLPIRCSRITEQRLLAGHGDDYLDQIEVIHVEEGTHLTQWLGRDVHCYELPGHDDGMIGFAPTDMAWFFVADLVQPMATVVIPEPEGNMQHYFESLQRVIDLQPRAILSSHGIPIGGTYLVEKTLQHRQERELQITELLEQGYDLEQMVQRLYRGINQKLIPLARQNVRQHLRKLGHPV